jgi:hypothetical protein
MLDRELLSELQLTLMEPAADGGDTWPSLIWTRDEVLDAVNAGLRALFRDVHLHVEGLSLPIAAGTTTIALPTDWLATAYLAWADPSGGGQLAPADSFEGDLALPGWEVNRGRPLAYADLDGAMRTVRLIPTPSLNGTVWIVYIATPPTVTGVAPGAVLPLADAFVSGVKYATLASLLRKVGRLLDPERADYCERRYDLTHMAASIILGGWS